MKIILIILLVVSSAVAQTPDPKVPPDNTKQNAGEQITAEQQGESAADRDTTAKIRQAIVKSDGLSGLAKNVKVITANGHVTLNGPVHSEQEKATIEGIAAQVVGKDKVKNNLKLKQSK